MELLREDGPQRGQSQLFGIIRIECGRPPEGMRALILGESPWAPALDRELAGAGMTVEMADSPDGHSGPFDLIVLFGEIPAGTLGALASPGALVVDAARRQKTEWTLHDPALHYRRIRVVSIAGF